MVTGGLDVAGADVDVVVALENEHAGLDWDINVVAGEFTQITKLLGYFTESYNPAVGWGEAAPAD